MKRFYQMLCLGAAFMASSSAFSEASEIVQSNQRCPVTTSSTDTRTKRDLFQQGNGLPVGKYAAGYNAPAGICLRNSWDFDVNASFIYWHVSQDGMDTALVEPSFTSSATTTVPGAVNYHNFSYQPGFKVGLGFNLDHDGWALCADYTWLHQTNSTVATAPALPTGAAGAWISNDWFTGSAAGTLPTSSSTWNMKLDMLDVVMQRPFYEGTMLVVKPYGGMRALWLREKFNLSFANTAGVVTGTSNNRSTSWALGPTTGVGGHWLLGSGFRFEGNAGASILYTRYTRILSAVQPSLTVLVGSSSTRNFNALRPVGELAVGLGWGMYCCDNEFYFDIGLDYEFLYFWEQNVMRMWATNQQGYVDNIGGLQMHGLTATFRFDF